MTVEAPKPDLTYERPLSATVAAAQQAGAILRAEFHRPGGPRACEGSRDHCDADVAAERLIRERLTDAFPQFGIRGEELSQLNCEARDARRHIWVIDPNDGTNAFLRGYRGSAVSIALLRGGEPVLGVVFAHAAPDDAGDLFAWADGCGPVTRNGKPVTRDWAERLDASHTVLVSQDADRNSMTNATLVAPARFRAVPSIAYRLALVAAGEGDAAVAAQPLCDWDYAAGHALLRGAGGELVGRDGQPVRYDAAGRSSCAGGCFGGAAHVAKTLATKDWESVFQRPQFELGRFGLVTPVPGLAIDDAAALDRATGCLLGQLAGDALGSLVEFRRAEQIAASDPGGVRRMHDEGHWKTLAGQPTDDSEMALMLARSIVARRAFDPRSVLEAYVYWRDGRAFDMGRTTATALTAASEALRRGEDPLEALKYQAVQTSQANGALMRVSPLGVFGHATAANRLAEWARADARLTHPHRVCQDASAVFVVAIAHAIRTGDSPRKMYDFAIEWAARAGACDEIRDASNAAATSRPADYFSKMGWVLTALQNAFYQLLHAPSVEEGVVDTIMRGGDTDTTAAICGALMGSVYGARSLPVHWKDRVLSCRPMEGLAGVRHPRPRDFWPVDAEILAERLLVLGQRAAEPGRAEKETER